MDIWELGGLWECKDCDTLFAAHSSEDLDKMMNDHIIKGCQKDVKEGRDDPTDPQGGAGNTPKGGTEETGRT